MRILRATCNCGHIIQLFVTTNPCIVAVIIRSRLNTYSSGTRSLSVKPQAPLNCKTFILTLNLSSLNIVAHRLRTPSINLTPNTVSRSQHLLDGALQLLRHRLEPHLPGNLDDLVQGDALRVLDVLLLLAVSRGLLQGFDNEGRGRGNDGDGGLTVLDGETDCDAQPFL